ncbi:MAG: hypothetical protein JWM09_371 [Francisellaceae bacterium]|nr:hypothetical protein [Francisellaceae bacterium]
MLTQIHLLNVTAFAQVYTPIFAGTSGQGLTYWHNNCFIFATSWPFPNMGIPGGGYFGIALIPVMSGNTVNWCCRLYSTAGDASISAVAPSSCPPYSGSPPCAGYSYY